MRFFESDGVPSGGVGDPPAPSAPPAGDPPSAPPAPDWNWTQPDGTFSEGWGDRLPEELKPELTTLGRYKSVTDLAKTVIEQRKMIGNKNLVAIPGADAKPEEIAAWRKAIGAPETEEGYDFNIDPALIPKELQDKLPESAKLTPELMKPFASWAHKHSIPASAIKEFAPIQAAMDAARQQAAIDMIIDADNQTLAEITKEWGGEEAAAKRLARANSAAKVLGVSTNIEENPIANHPQFIKLLDRVASQMKEDTLVNNSGNGITSAPGKARAMEIIDKRAGQDSADYWGENGPDRQAAAVKKVQDLLKEG